MNLTILVTIFLLLFSIGCLEGKKDPVPLPRINVEIIPGHKPKKTEAPEDAHFDAFATKFHKKYKNEAEGIKRKAIILKKINKIDKHNLDFKNKKHEFAKKIYKFHDMTQEEIDKKLKGLKLPDHLKNRFTEEKTSKKVKRMATTLNYSLPPLVDNKPMFSPPKDQGECGSCWAFSTAAMLEAAHFKKTGEVISLSEQHLIDCSADNEDCEGGWPPSALTEWQTKARGVQLNQFYPYIGEKGSCMMPGEETGFPVTGRFPPDPMEYIFNSGGEALLQSLVMEYGAVSVGINACEDWQDYYKGVFDADTCNTGCVDVNHAVTVVGYDIISPTPYWIVRNSWGVEWGEEGYIKMAMGNNTANIGCYAVSAIV